MSFINQESNGYDFTASIDFSIRKDLKAVDEILNNWLFVCSSSAFYPE